MPTEEAKYERRANATGPKIVKRKDSPDGDEMACVEGYAAVFYDEKDPGTEYELYEDLKERIAPECFNRAIAEGQPCRCFVNHDVNYRIGRCDKGTLRLKVDDCGLHYSADIPDTQVGKDTMTDLENGNLDGSSFSFRVTGQRWEDFKMADGSYMTVRTLTDVDICDVGPVSLPAYAATTAGLRSTESPAEVRAARDKWREARDIDAMGKELAAKFTKVGIRRRVVEVAQAMDS